MCNGRIMIAGTNSGCGKTTVVCGLLKCLLNRKMNIHAFKCGPDYIDTSFHKKVVVNAITLETLSLAQESIEKLGYEYSVTQICASRGRKVGGYNMMTAQNPVFIICGEKL